MIRLFRRHTDDWRILRWRMIAETSLYLDKGLETDSWGVRIPCIPVGRGSFTRIFSRQFWQQVLFESS
jgi:hypothetical protein